MEKVHNNHEFFRVPNIGNDIYPLKSVLMVGGKGIRLEPITKNLIPKGFVTIDDKNEVREIDYLTQSLNNIGIQNPILSVHHYADTYEEYASRKTYEIFRRKGEVGNGGALEQLIQQYGYDTQYLVISADIFVHPKDIQKLISEHKPETISWGVTKLDYELMEDYYGLVVDDKSKAILGDIKLPWWKNWDLMEKSLYVKGAIQIIDPSVYIESVEIYKRLCKKAELDLYWDISPLIEERNRRRIRVGKSSMLQAVIFDHASLDYGTPERLQIMRNEYQKLINE